MSIRSISPQSGRLADRDTLSDVEHRVIVETSLDAIITMNQRGIITSWNPQAEAIFGWTRGEAVGRVLAETIIPPRYRQAHERGLDRYLFDGTGPVLGKVLDHLTGLHKDGHEFLVELSISPATPHGTSLTFVAFVRDITERKRSEAALKAAVAEVLAVAGLLQQVVDDAGPTGDPRTAELLDFTRQAAQRLRGLVERSGVKVPESPMPKPPRRTTASGRRRPG